MKYHTFNILERIINELWYQDNFNILKIQPCFPWAWVACERNTVLLTVDEEST